MKKEEFFIPEKYRNKLYKFQAGGYDGCICHPAALFVTKDGRVRFIGSDGGRGGLDEGDWYDRKIRSFLNDLNVYSPDALLYGPQKDLDAYKRYQDYAVQLRKERHVRERVRVFEALENELGKDDIPGWDHEFLEYDISTPDLVRECCKIMCKSFYDVYAHAGIAQKLSEEGYEGAGFVCSDCGKYVESCSLEDFNLCIDSESYRGIGGLAVAHTRILCEQCREDCECGICYELDCPNRNKPDNSESDWGNYDFLACVLNAWLDCCWGCAGGYEYDYLYYWSDADRQRYRTELGKQYEVLEESLMEAYGGRKGHELYVELTKTPEGRKKINEIRDLLASTVEEKFGSSVSEDWFKDRLDIHACVQTELMEEGK